VLEWPGQVALRGREGERVASVGGLGWVGVGCCVVVIVGGFSTVSSGWSGLSVIVLTLGVAGTLVGSAVGVLGMAGGSKGKSDWVGGEEGTVVLASTAVALVLGRAWPHLSCCNRPVNYFQQAFIVVLHLRWEVTFVCVLGGRLVGLVVRWGVLSLALAASAVSKGLLGV